jgi:GT2 family glycosyltransferase/SAM-dependent methyltransferase
LGEIFERAVVDVPLAWTGERLTSTAGPQVEIEHLHRYFLARALCRGLDVLDVASGEGYGSAFLAQTALSVIGVELDVKAVAHAQTTYVAPNLRYLQGDARRLPLIDACVDVVVSFETIEHFYQHDSFLAEVRRVLRPGGRFVVSSPERDVYSPAGTPPNPHHVRELTRTELLTLLRGRFGNVLLQGQRPLLGSALVAEGPRSPGARALPLTFERRGPNRFEESEGLSRPVYLVAVASDAPIEDVPDSLYIESSAIEEALVQLPMARDAAQQATAALVKAGEFARHLEAEVETRDHELAELRSYARHLETEVETRDRELVELRSYARHLETELGARERGLADLRDQARRLEANLAARDRSLAETDALLAEARRSTKVLVAEQRTTTAALAEANRVAAEKHAELAQVISYLRHVEANYAQAHNAVTVGEDYGHKLEAELARLQVELAFSQEELARLQIDSATISNDLLRISAEHYALVSSSSWRITRPLRNAFVRRPKTARTLRRAAKLVWWTATLQLPSRIAARRSASPARHPVLSSLSEPKALEANAAPSRAELADEVAVFAASAAPGVDGNRLITSHGQPEAPKPDTASTRAELTDEGTLLGAPVVLETDEKGLFAARARAELLDFLSSGERLVVPAYEHPEVSVVVVLWNHAHLTLRCVRALLGQGSASLEIVLLDNASGDETAELLARIDGARVLRSDTNEGFLIGCNKAVAASRGRVVLLLNSDAFVRPGALGAALAALDASPDIGAVGGKLILPSGRLQEAGSIVWSDASTHGYGRGLPPEAGEAMFRRDVDYCSGAFLMTPRALWDQLGGFDELFIPAYYEEADYCMRLRDLGYRVVYEPTAEVDHYEFGSEERHGDAVIASRRNRKLFRSRHSTALRQRHLPPAQANMLIARQSARTGLGRLLIIDNELPLTALGSGYPRMRRLLAEAGSLGWSVTFFPLHRPHINWREARAEISWEIEVAAEWGASALGSFLAERQGYYDAILVSRPDNMTLANAAWRDHPHVIDGCRVIYDAEALFCTRDIVQAAVEGLPPPDADALISAEVRLADGADAIVCVTQAEADIFRSRVPTLVHVLSHPTEIFANTPEFSQRDGFLFVGRLLERETPNWRGLAWFIHDCWPLIRLALPTATLQVVGHLHADHAELEAPGVHLLGPVTDLQPLYDSARLFIAPVRFAAGIPIKILEATAAGLPTVGTRLMAHQLEWTPGVEMVAEDDPAALATASISLYQDAALWRRLRTAAKDRLRREHSADLFRAALRALLNGEPPSPSPHAILSRLPIEAHNELSSRECLGGVSAPHERAPSIVTEAETNAPVSPGFTIHQADSDEDARRVERVNEVWAGANPVWSGEAKQWMSHPMVQERINQRASGHPHIDAYAHLKATLLALGWNLPVARAASLCCGEGSLERELVKQGFAKSVIGYDLAKDAIEKARLMAEAEGLTGLTYEVRDLEHFGLSETGLDIVFALSGLHHLAQLEKTFDAVYKALRSGGVFHVHEYVGPDRFQWTDRQLHEINSFLDRLPDRYHRLPDGTFKPHVRRPTIQEMLDTDPSEAVRSSKIEPLLAERFQILDRRELGGTLLHMALSNIAQNFNPDDAEDRYWIMELFDSEDRLMAEGTLTSDFTVITAQRL